MNIFYTVLETVSDSVFLITTIILIRLFITTNVKVDNQFKKRFFIALILSSFISVFFGNNYLSFDSKIVQLVLFAVNFSKYFFLSSYIYQIIKINFFIISLIVQFICSTLTTSFLIFIPHEAISNTHWVNISILFIVRLITLFISFCINNKSAEYNLQTIIRIIPMHIYIVALFTLFLLSGIIQTINYDNSNIDLKIFLIKLFSLLLIICISIIMVSLLFNVISKKYQNDINSMLKKQVGSQIYHYKQFEKINTEIRSFKHDYINHMKCMSSMLSNGEYAELSDYICNLSASFPTVSYLFETGNYIADAILTEKQISSPDDISIKFEGVVPTFIDNTDLCIILSNALDNAVEACILCSGNKVIEVYSSIKHGYFVLKIKNPTINDIEKSKLATTKSDTVNHGFGLFNIRRTVKKYSGHVSTSCEKNIFTLNIAFSETNENART